MPHREHAHGNRPIEGRHSRNYDRMARLLMTPVYRRIARDLAASAPQGVTVLDIGTGPGILLRELARLRPDLRLAGVDLAADMIALAGRNLGDRAELHTADAAALPFEDDRFDLVASTYSSHHWGDPQAGGAEIARVLRTGGRLLNYDFPHAPWEALTRGPGLTVVRRTPFNAGWTSLIIKTTRLEAEKQPR